MVQLRLLALAGLLVVVMAIGTVNGENNKDSLRFEGGMMMRSLRKRAVDGVDNSTGSGAGAGAGAGAVTVTTAAVSISLPVSTPSSVSTIDGGSTSASTPDNNPPSSSSSSSSSNAPQQPSESSTQSSTPTQQTSNPSSSSSPQISDTTSSVGTSASTAASITTTVNPTSTITDASSTSTSGLSSSTAYSQTSTSSALGSASSSALVSTVIITTTASNGVVITSASLSTALAASHSASTSNGGGSDSKAWAIPLGVVGGIVGLAGVLFLAYRCTNRRFSDLDDEGGNAIRWPELLKRNEDETTTLNPLGTKRRDGVAGIGIDMDENSSISDFNSINQEKQFNAVGLTAPGMVVNSSANSSGTAEKGMQPGPGSYYPNPEQAYYDPYLGNAGPGALHPVPRSNSPFQSNAAPIYDPSAYGAGPGEGHPYPPLSHAPSGSPQLPAGAATRQFGSTSPFLHLGSPPLKSQTQGRVSSGSPRPEIYVHHRNVSHDSLEMSHVGSPLPQNGLGASPPQKYRLSVANPDEDD